MIIFYSSVAYCPCTLLRSLSDVHSWWTFSSHTPVHTRRVSPGAALGVGRTTRDNCSFSWSVVSIPLNVTSAQACIRQGWVQYKPQANSHSQKRKTSMNLFHTHVGEVIRSWPESVSGETPVVVHKHTLGSTAGFSLHPQSWPLPASEDPGVPLCVHMGGSLYQMTCWWSWELTTAQHCSLFFLVVPWLSGELSFLSSCMWLFLYISEIWSVVLIGTKHVRGLDWMWKTST